MQRHKDKKVCIFLLYTFLLNQAYPENTAQLSSVWNKSPVAWTYTVL